MAYFIGFDVGSSKTHALIVDEGGQCRGFGQAWGGNQQTVGYDGLANALQKSFEQARLMAGISADQVRGAGFGIAGYDFPSDREAHLKAIASLGLDLPGGPGERWLQWFAGRHFTAALGSTSPPGQASTAAAADRMGGKGALSAMVLPLGNLAGVER